MQQGIELQIDTGDLQGLLKAFKEAPDVAAEEMVRATWEASLLMEREAKENTPTGIGGGGGLKGSISSREPRVLADQVIGELGTPMIYAVPVEEGSKPHFPPIKPLADWAEHKLGLTPAEAQSVGFLIARKIAAHGTKGVKMFERAFDANQHQVQRIYAKARERIANRMRGAK